MENILIYFLTYPDAVAHGIDTTKHHPSIEKAFVVYETALILGDLSCIYCSLLSS
ncbi:uncharacterized protein METZ01_LOCUS84798 [marine metagenome]|uniref:Uncharacterized protein n=1 Tax=marine metagenome TaxID=408172 RepID=A0A381UVF1_9ZZZZ